MSTNNTDTQTATNIAVQTPVKRGRGRPKGSRNKPKVAAVGVTNTPVASEVTYNGLK
jgi:hypothetical protein